MTLGEELADALDPIIEAIRTHVMSAERVHADDTTVPVLAKMKAVLGRIWTYVRDDRPFGGQHPPAALFYYSRNRAGEHPQGHLAGYVGVMQADAFNGYNDLYCFLGLISLMCALTFFHAFVMTMPPNRLRFTRPPILRPPL